MSTDFDKEKFDEVLAENEKLYKINEMWRKKFHCQRDKRLLAENLVDDLGDDIKSFKEEYGRMKQEIKKLHNDNQRKDRVIDKFNKKLKTIEGRLARLKNTNGCQRAVKIEKKLNKLEEEHGLVQEELEEIKGCQICNEPFDHEARPPAKINCGHILYCKDCLLKIAQSNAKCPTCRTPFKKKDIERVNLSFI